MASENPDDAVQSVQLPGAAKTAAEQPGEGDADPAQESANSKSASNARDEKGSGRRSRFESILPNLIRRGIEKSIEAGLNTIERGVESSRETTGAVREVLHEVKAPREVAVAVGRALSEAKLPREIASAVFGQIDETKNDVLRIVARELRDFLEATDLATEIKKALTSLSFEVRTEVRFIPNEAGQGVKADVRSRTRVKRNPPSRNRQAQRARSRAKPVDESGDAELSDDDDLNE